jgi:hypothetical protein
MKKKSRLLVPFLGLFSVSVALMALVALPISKKLFVIEGIIAVVSFVAALIIYLFFSK